MSDYQLFTDQITMFECKVELEGVSTKHASARIILERVDDVSLLFEGTIGRDGICEIPIGKLRGLMDENETGTMRLEVIAEDVYFPAWESSFKVIPSKRVAITEISQPNKSVKPSAKVTLKEEVLPETKLVTSIVTTLKENAITVNNIKNHRNFLREVIAENLDKYKLDNEPPQLISQIVTALAR